MKMAKATEKDIEAAGRAMAILDDISRGYFPAREGEDDFPIRFDPTDWGHLQAFYERIGETLDTSPGWPGRVIGGMCFVILFDENKIIDPDADTLEVHPRFEKVAAELEAVTAQRDNLLKLCQNLIAYLDANPPMGESIWALRLIREAVAAIVGPVDAACPQPIRPGDVLRLKPNDDACSGPCKKYFPETLFLCVGFDGVWIKARSHFGTPKLGPVMLWKTDGDNFDVIGHVALPAEGAPT